MKRILMLSICLSACLWMSAQKNSVERIAYNLYYLPEKLIYDEIKSYSYSVSFEGERNPFSPAEIRAKALKFDSYKEADQGDMNIQYRFGPFTFIDRKIETSKNSRTVNGRKEEYTAYYYKFSALYPMTVSVTNTKNGYVMYRSTWGKNTKEPNIELSTTKFESEQALADYWKNSQHLIIGDALAGTVNGCNYTQSSYSVSELEQFFG